MVVEPFCVYLIETQINILKPAEQSTMKNQVILMAEGEEIITAKINVTYS